MRTLGSAVLDFSVKSRFWIIGIPKARVFPDPVLALPQTSLPESASGIVRVCIGNGEVMARSKRTSQISLSTPRSLHV